MGVEYQKHLIKFNKRVIIIVPHLNIRNIVSSCRV